MSALLRILLVATALASSGGLQVAAAMGEDLCCVGEHETEEESAPCSDCPPGLACACCPIRGAVQSEAPQVAPAAPAGVAIAVAAAEPSLGASVADIFHPPRA